MNEPGPVPDPARCPHCQAEVYWSEATQCWLCGQSLDRPGPAVAPPPPPMEPARRTFGLSSLMLVIALVAVCLGVYREVPGLGILLAILVTPALVRTSVVATRRKAGGRPMPPLDKVGVFAGTLAAVVVIGVSAIAAFAITCFPIGLAAFSMGRNGGVLGVTAFLVGFCAALAAGYGAYRLIRRIGRRKD
jgi:hypothetical protein